MMPVENTRAAEPPIVIVGAGLAGSLLACCLGRTGRPVRVYEKRPDPHLGPAERGRSINLALSVRGIHALAEIGLADEVLRQSVLMRGRMIHARDGRLTFQPYGKDDTEALHSVSRAGLNRQLVEAAARHDSVRFFFGQRCHGLTGDGAGVEFADEKQKVLAVRAAAIIGADGAYSAVRAWMQKREGFNYQQEYLTHGYKELTIPAGADGSYLLEKHALHIWPRGNFMMIALPNLDGSFTCTLFWPFEGPSSFAALKSEADVLAFFRDQFPDAVPLLPGLAEEFLHNPTGALVTIRCQPWVMWGGMCHARADAAAECPTPTVGAGMPPAVLVGDACHARADAAAECPTPTAGVGMPSVVLVGDACHAVVPFLGQGMNAAFEDCSVLVKCLEEMDWNWTAAATRYEAARKIHTDTLADLCALNFIEMRDRVASPWFLLRKRIGVLLHALFPRFYLPLYTMIEFTRIPYADAVQRARRQNRVVACIAALVGIAILAAWLFLIS
jgi:kynurenine 3-monooxygenase